MVENVQFTHTFLTSKILFSNEHYNLNQICIFNKNSKSYSPLIVLTFCLSPVRWASSTISFPNCEKQLTKSVNVVTEYSSFRVLDTYSKELETNLEIIHMC